MRKVTLQLVDGSQFHGFSFGYEQPVAGEVVFNTAMAGYPESLTDPSYAGQILAFTYPLIGNYGVPPITKEANGLSTYMESERIWPRAIIVSDYTEKHSHWNAQMSLGEWLKQEKVPAITGVDTRQLTKILRESGVMTGKILFDDDPNNIPADASYEGVNFIAQVTCPCISIYKDNKNVDFPPTTTASTINDYLNQEPHEQKRVVLVDCGVKQNILRCLLKRRIEIIRVPWDYDFNEINYDGLFLANGPGDPDTAGKTVEHVRHAMELYPERPIFGICMGNQLLAKAAGARIYKLKYGHRSFNQPVREVGTNRCFITVQNHGYAVDDSTLGSDWEPLFVNMNDGSNEGIKHKHHPWFSTQFHPEAAGGPVDTEFSFDLFARMLN